MKGTTTLRFNQATVVEAVQEYLNKRLTSDAGKQIVLSVLNDSNAYGGGAFEVKIEEKTDVS